MNNLVIVGHPDKNSFCHSGIFYKIQKILSDHPSQDIKTIDLYEDIDISIMESPKEIKESIRCNDCIIS